ncbi:Na/Pi cotransporter family protein [Alteraurantiacibacter palmitatis]|uniref:Na/Pi cotransporter family protein n=1 Tax=Alteraurantiacibacter palmitatis TaxID=2054628 RepID=A0ABV7E6B3_9SPHN
MDGYVLFEIGVSIAAAVILFIYALKGFSNDIRRAGGAALDRLLTRLTGNPVTGFGLGALLTALVQSSSAISGITVALVQAGTISFRGSLPVFLGANVGTTSTAWLVAINATILGPFLIVLSALMHFAPQRIRLFGHAVLYLGIILLALQLISSYVAPLRQSEEVAAWLIHASNPWVGLLIGVVMTALLQSSSVVVGLAVVAVSQGLLTTPDVVPIVLGANIGTTSTALFAALSMGAVAKRAAFANLVFNAAGVLAFLPFLGAFSAFVVGMTGPGTMAVATAHLLFNLGVAVIGFALIPLVTRFYAARPLGPEV